MIALVVAALLLAIIGLLLLWARVLRIEAQENTERRNRLGLG